MKKEGFTEEVWMDLSRQKEIMVNVPLVIFSLSFSLFGCKLAHFFVPQVSCNFSEIVDWPHEVVWG